MVRKKVLIAVHINTFFIELERVAALLHDSRDYDPILLFGWPYPTIQRDIEACLARGWKCYGESGMPCGHDGSEDEQPAVATVAEHPSSHVATAEPKATLIGRMTRRLSAIKERVGKHLSPHWNQFTGAARRLLCGDYDYYLAYHEARYRFACDILAKTGAELLIMGGDMVGYDTSDFVRAAHERQIPVVLIPSTMSNGLEQAEAYYHDASYHLRSLANVHAAIRYPKWLRRHRGRWLLRRPAGDIFAMEKLGTAPPLPWVFNSGFADAVCVESQAMKDYYTEAGLPEDFLLAVGTLANDLLAHELQSADREREELLNRLGLPAERKTLVTALPPDFLYLPGGRPECDFRHYDDLVSFWMEPLRELDDWNVVVALHPSVSREEMLHLESDNVRIAYGNTARLVPICDFYVASVSSTIRWAIACGKPVVNYDVYRYHYTDFTNVPGVLYVEEQEDYRNAIKKLAHDESFYCEVKKKQEAIANYWGNLDGRTGERMLALFDAMTRTTAAIAA